MSNQRSRRPAGVFETAEAVFKAPIKQAPLPPKPLAIPKAKQQVSLRIDQDVLEHFQEQGAGWQDKLNMVLRKAIGFDEVS